MLCLQTPRWLTEAVNCYRCDTPVPDHSRFCVACGADVSGDAAQATEGIEPDPELETRLAAEVVGEFEIERLIGRGGMAAVYLGRDVHLSRSVAIKVLPPELSHGPGIVERFKREARTAATLDHPHIVPIYRISSGGKIVWFAMKYLEGESLEQILSRERSFSPARSSRIIAQVAEALMFAHEHGVIHRDVKPANVMLDQRDWVTVTDFGIAKATDMEPLTGSGAMIGTPFYMSPEQCAGKQPITGASDQYSLAVMAYQMLCGRLPFVGETTVDIIKQQCFDQPPSLQGLRPELPAGLTGVVERALRKEPERRFGSVADFASAFTVSLHGEPPTVPIRAPDTRTKAARRSLERTGRRGWRLGGVLGVVALLAGLGLYLSSGGSGKSENPPMSVATPRQTGPPPLDSVAAIDIAGVPGALQEGEQVALRTIVRGVQGDTLQATVRWTSRDSAVASVSEDGVVTGLRSGTATITASTDTHHADAAIVVQPAGVAAVGLERRTDTITSGQTVRLRATVTDAKGRALSGRSIRWTSTDSRVATVAPDGAVTGRAPGVARVLASSGNGKTGLAVITVVPLEVTPPAPGVLQLNVLPGWAEISIDGRERGRHGTYEVVLPAGVPHSLHLEHDGFVTVDTLVLLQPGDTSRITIEMKRKSQ